MANRISDQGRSKQKRGTGSGQTWIPWHKTSDFGSSGRTAQIPSQLFPGRTIEALSKNETNLIYIAEMARGVKDLREQYPLDLDLTRRIASQLGIKHPYWPNPMSEIVTIDLLVDFDDGRKEAFSVKAYSDLLDPRTLEKAELEDRSVATLNIKWNLITDLDFPRFLIENLRILRSFFKNGDKLKNEVWDLIQKLSNDKTDLADLLKSISKKLNITIGRSLEIFKHFCATKKITFDYYSQFSTQMKMYQFNIHK